MSGPSVLRLFLVFLFAFGLAAPARAQSTVERLRARLEAVRAHRPDSVPEGTLESIAYLIENGDRIRGRFDVAATEWLDRARDYLEAVEQGRDPYPTLRGKIANRGYVSPISQRRQGYTVYLPPDYDPAQAYPLVIVLHGGSSNGNLFLGVVLGNNMDWLTYDQHLWDSYEPRWFPNSIVVAPDGFGQVMWRWMGEQDVLDVLDDVQRHYHVDPNRVVLNGLSNGGVGTHNIGLRHAWRFSAVWAMAGAPSWLQYTGGRPTSSERAVMESLSGMQLLDNAWDTQYRYFHGHVDPGPMRPAYIEELDALVARTGVPARGTWYDAGHDILYIVHRHGRIYEDLARIVRDPRPARAVCTTGDYRAARQHWVTVTRLEDYPHIGQVDARAEDGVVRATTRGVLAFSIDLRDAPTGQTPDVKIAVDGADVLSAPRAELGHVVHLVRIAGAWRPGFPEEHPGRLEKQPRLSGPIMDAYYERMIHVYGTQEPEHVEALRRAAQRGAHGWPLWLWNVDQPVMADTEVTADTMKSATIVLYGTQRDNSVLARMWDRLPIRVTEDAVIVGGQRYEGTRVGTKFIYPNPLEPTRYVIVQSGVSTDAVADGYNLPDFVGDYVVYDPVATRARARLIAGRAEQRASGLFDRFWRLPGATAQNALPPTPRDDEGAGGDGPLGGDENAPHEAWGGTLPVPEAPPLPPEPAEFLAPARDPAGRVARALAHRIPTFRNWRAEIHGATWVSDPAHVWSIRPRRECLRALDAAHIAYEEVTTELATPVAVPVVVTGRVGGVLFDPVDRERRLVVSCELAARLPAIAAILRRFRVRVVNVTSSYRDHPRPSFHTFGLALDMGRFQRDDGTWMAVEGSFAETPDQHTCEAPAPSDERARALLGIACALAESRQFNSVLTPNYNPGHRDHFHVDMRPDDPRFFVR